ncbi:class I SAM-dependent methyltransferase [Micromonospora gifhornensis]|uniref:class I SAM-dependent methyltransferase n=1 Tax=Micromonospora gifhornensis TaxID=84594 RepID=UPI003D75FCCA
MAHDFDKAYWEQRWRQGAVDRPGSMSGKPPNPYLVREIGTLAPGTALDAGCGAGAEAIWLASQGWQVTAADISSEALTRAAERAAASGVSERLTWIEADLSRWVPQTRFDLVTTHYAHPAMPQLEFYDRLAEWVAPAGTLLIVGHLHPSAAPAHGHGHGHGHGDERDPGHERGDGHEQGRGHDRGHGHGHQVGERPPAEASATAAAITARLNETEWEILTAEESQRTLTGPRGEITLNDVVVRAIRRPQPPSPPRPARPRPPHPTPPHPNADRPRRSCTYRRGK